MLVAQYCIMCIHAIPQCMLDDVKDPSF